MGMRKEKHATNWQNKWQRTMGSAPLPSRHARLYLLVGRLRKEVLALLVKLVLLSQALEANCNPWLKKEDLICVPR